MTSSTGCRLSPWHSALFCLLAAILSGCGINNIPTYDEQIKTTWAQVENQYQRRADLVPSLVKTVQAYAGHERETLQAVTEVRAKASSLQLDSNLLNDPAKLQQFEAAQSQLSSALSRLMVVVERYQTSRQTRTSPACNPSWKVPRTGSVSRAGIISRQCSTTTRKSAFFPAVAGSQPLQRHATAGDIPGHYYRG